MSIATLLTLLGSGSLSILVTGVLNFWATRKKLGAETDKLGTEATKVITEAASGVVKDLREDNAQLRNMLKDRDERIARIEGREDLLEDHVRALRDWASQAVVAIRSGDTSFALPLPRFTD